MKRRRFIFIGVAVVILVASVVVFGWLISNQHPATLTPSVTSTPAASTATPPSPTTSLGPVPQEVSDSIARLASDPSGQLASVSPFHSQAAATVPAGSEAKTVPATWDQGSDTTGSVSFDFTPPGGQSKRYTAMMLKENGQWKVFATVEETQ